MPTNLVLEGNGSSICFLIAFCLETLIPAGPMPDIKSAAGVVPKVVIYSSSGHNSVDVATLYTGDTAPIRSADFHDQSCEFACVVAVASGINADVLITQFVASGKTYPSNDFAYLPLVRAGPTLASRAPPSVS